MIIYELGARGFESHCSHLESFAYPKVSHKGSKGGGTVWHIWFLILLGTVLYWTNRFNPNKLFQRNSDCASENARYRWNFVKTFPKARYFFFWYVLSIQGRDRKGENEGKWYTYFFASGGRRGWRYDRMVGNFENLSMCPPTPCPLFSGKPCAHILKLALPI